MFALGSILGYSWLILGLLMVCLGFIYGQVSVVFFQLFPFVEVLLSGSKHCKLWRIWHGLRKAQTCYAVPRGIPWVSGKGQPRSDQLLSGIKNGSQVVLCKQCRIPKRIHMVNTIIFLYSNCIFWGKPRCDKIGFPSLCSRPSNRQKWLDVEGFDAKASW